MTVQTAPLKLIALVRVSSKTQALWDTPATQRALVADIARDHGAKIVGSVDVAITVSDLAFTPGWRSVIVPILADPTVHIATYALDRIARPQDFGRDLIAIEALRAAGKRIYLPDEAIDLGTPQGFERAFDIIKGAGAERAKIKRRTRDGKRRHARAGHWVGGSDKLPTGISYDKKTHVWGYTPEADKVKMAYDLLVSQGMSYGAIAKRIGLTSAGANNLIRKPIYKGIFISEYHTTPEGVRVYGGADQPQQLVSDATWDAAQAIARRRSIRRQKSLPEHDQPDYVYSGFVGSAYEPVGEVGAREGGIIVFSLPTAPKPPKHTVYTYSVPEGAMMACRCLGAGEGHRCGLRSWQPAERLIQMLDTYLAQVTAAGSFVAQVTSRLEQQPRRDVAAERAALQAQVGDLDAGLDRLAGALAYGRLDQARYDRMWDDVSKQKAAIAHEIKALDAIPPTPTERDLRVMARALAFDPSWDARAKRAWLERFDVRITISNDGVEGCTVVLPPEKIEDGQEVWGPRGVLFKPQTWVDIAGGYDPTDHHTWLEREKGLYRIARAAELLGTNPNRLYYLIRRSYIAAPTTKIGKVAYWTRDDIEAARATLEARPRHESSPPAGSSPRKRRSAARLR